MAHTTHDEATAYLVRWSDGEAAALGEAMAAVYAELRNIAGSILRGERGDHTLEPAALIHEVYLRLSRRKDTVCLSRSRFFAICRRSMRCILVEHARRRHSQRRGGDRRRLRFDDFALASPAPPTAVGRLGAALRALTAESPQLAAVVRMRYFEGRTAEEIAAKLGFSVPTVSRRWRVARAWLFRYLEADRSG